MQLEDENLYDEAPMNSRPLKRLHQVDILHGAQFDRDTLDALIRLAQKMQTKLRTKRSLDDLHGYILATLFFEPSTRTRLSFEAAMQRLGGSVIGFASADATSVAKGETLADTIRTIDQYADAIVIRHPRIGSAEEAAAVAENPVINAGDGAGQHPTQALLDLYTIHAERGELDNTSILLCGDLKYGRTIHAGVELYKHFAPRLILVSPEELRLPTEIIEPLKKEGIKIEETSELEDALPQAEVLYMTRIQKERFNNPAEYDRYKNRYILTREMIDRLNPDVTILHPLPRVSEIDESVDELNNAAYFRQVRNGIYMRMALLTAILKDLE